MEETTIEVVEPVIEQEEVEEKVTPEQIAAALEELNARKAEFDVKLYLVAENGKEYGENLKAWLINDAKWNYSEAIAITKLTDEAVSTGLAKITNGEAHGKFYMLGIELKALDLMFKKFDGKGYHSAKKFRDIFVPIHEVLKASVMVDDKIIDRLKFQIAAWTEGIKPAPEVSLEEPINS